MPIMAFIIEDKKMYPIFDFAKCYWSLHSKMVRLWLRTLKWWSLASMHTANRKKTLSQTLQFHVKFMCMLS